MYTCMYTQRAPRLGDLIIGHRARPSLCSNMYTISGVAAAVVVI